MRLAPDETRIEIRELEEITYFATRSMGWEAELTGVGIGSPKTVEHLNVSSESDSLLVHISLQRWGSTPDNALKNLFEAAHEAGIWL